MRVSLREGRFAVSEWASVYDVDVAIPTGPFREAASADLYPWLLDLLRRAETDLNTTGGLSEAALWGLRALDVRLLVFEDGETPLIPPDAARGLRPRPSVPALEVPDASPVLGLLNAAELETLLARPDRDWAAALAAVPAALRTPTVVVDDPHRDSRSLGFRFQAPTDGFLVLSLARLPGLTVTVDGRDRPVRPGPYGLAAVEVTAGDHDLEATFTPTSLLAITRAASLLSLALFVVLFTGLAVRRRQTV